MSNDTISANQTIAVPSASVRMICAGAFLIGASLVFLVGFANASVIHNVAHDTRHSLAFPCH
ncbi:MAG: CbtB domain-containing protein [Hyphomicrobium sp.]